MAANADFPKTILIRGSMFTKPWPASAKHNSNERATRDRSTAKNKKCLDFKAFYIYNSYVVEFRNYPPRQNRLYGARYG